MPDEGVQITAIQNSANQHVAPALNPITVHSPNFLVRVRWDTQGPRGGKSIHLVMYHPHRDAAPFAETFAGGTDTGPGDWTFTLNDGNMSATHHSILVPQIRDSASGVVMVGAEAKVQK